MTPEAPPRWPGQLPFTGILLAQREMTSPQLPTLFTEFRDAAHAAMGT